MKVTGTRSEIIQTCYSLDLEHEGKKYTVNMFSSDHNSYMDWYDEEWNAITRPDWADDLDLFELYNENEGKI